MTKAQMMLHSRLVPETKKGFMWKSEKKKHSSLRDELFGPLYPLTEQNEKYSFHRASIRSWHLPEGCEEAYLSLFACFEYVAGHDVGHKKVAAILNKYGWVPNGDFDASNNFRRHQMLGRAFGFITRRDIGNPTEQFNTSYQNALVEREKFESISDKNGRIDVSYWQNAVCPEVRVKLWGSEQYNERFVRTSLDAILPFNLKNAVWRATEHDSIAGHFINAHLDDSSWCSYSDGSYDFRYAIGKKDFRGRDHSSTRFYSIVAPKKFGEREGWSDYQLPEIYLGISCEYSHA